MSLLPPPLRRKRSRSYYVGAAAFGSLLFGLCAALYIATVKVDYVWRWNRIPQYFFYKAQLDIRSDMEGEIAGVSGEGDTRRVLLKGADGEHVYEVPAKGLRVAQGDLISAGDILGVKEQWRAGLLMQGLALTIKVSVIATVFGVLIGLFAGIARVSANPFFRWTAVTYVEIIRGSPLMIST